MTAGRDPGRRRPGGLVVAVVVTHNSEDVVDALLDSLPAAFQDLPYRTVVVDNGSTDGTAQRVQLRGDCLVLEQPNRGYAAGINTGVRAVPEADRVLVLDRGRLAFNHIVAIDRPRDPGSPEFAELRRDLLGRLGVETTPSPIPTRRT